VTAEELADRLRPIGALETLEKLGFTLDFVARNVVSSDAPVSVSQIAMLWMGMPNKHDRKRTRHLLELLTEAGLMECVDAASETWRAKSV
jgi:hypothetical protein